MSPIAPSETAPLGAELRRNRRVAIICAAVFVGMIGASFAAVPLYRAFCQVTGFDGTVRRAAAAPTTVLTKGVTVRFDTNVRDVPFKFWAEQTAQPVKLGETKLALFKVSNTSARDVTARAVFNVVPEQAGAYFQKLECFCFSEQTIKAGQTVEFPVLYFVDPKYADDFETKGKGEVTLSYTFYPAVNGQGGAQSADASQAKPVSGLGGQPRAGL